VELVACHGRTVRKAQGCWGGLGGVLTEPIPNVHMMRRGHDGLAPVHWIRRCLGGLFPALLALTARFRPSYSTSNRRIERTYARVLPFSMDESIGGMEAGGVLQVLRRRAS
jgi:hypothetical protein